MVKATDPATEGYLTGTFTPTQLALQLREDTQRTPGKLLPFDVATGIAHLSTGPVLIGPIVLLAVGWSITLHADGHWEAGPTDYQ